MAATLRMYHRDAYSAIELLYGAPGLTRASGFAPVVGEIVLTPGKAPILVTHTLQADTEAGVLAMAEALAYLTMLYRAVVAWHELPDGRDGLKGFFNGRQFIGKTITPESLRDAAKAGKRAAARA